MSEPRQTVGARIRHLRQTRGLSEVALARRLGVGPATVGAWERNDRPVRDVYLEPLARALGVSISDLSPEHPTARLLDGAPREESWQESFLQALVQILTVAAAANVVASGDTARRLSALGARIWGEPPSPPADILPQTDAAATLGVSRQAVHRLVAEGRVKGYPNPERPDRAPMVSLAEVRSVVKPRGQSETGSAAGDGEEEGSGPSG